VRPRADPLAHGSHLPTTFLEGLSSFFAPCPSRRRASTLRYGCTRSLRDQALGWPHGHPSSHAVRARGSLRDRTACRRRCALFVDQPPAACRKRARAVLPHSLQRLTAAALLPFSSAQRSAVCASRPRQLQRQCGTEGNRRRCDHLYTAGRAWLPKFRVTAGAAAECLLRTDPNRPRLYCTVAAGEKHVVKIGINGALRSRRAALGCLA